MKACGLVHSKRFTVPVTVVGLAMLYIAVEWCAKEGIAPGSIPSAIARPIMRKFILKSPLLFFLEKLTVIGVMFADELIYFGHVRAKRESSAHRPWFHKDIRIVQRRLIFERVVFAA